MSSWIYLCFIDYSNKLSHWQIVEKLSYEMNLIYENSMWLERNVQKDNSVKEFQRQEIELL